MMGSSKASVRPPARAVFIGGSAGALSVASALLRALPCDFGPAVGIVLHLPPKRPSVLAEALAEASPIPLREPEDKEPLAPSTAYLAPPDYQLLIDPGPCFALSIDEPVNYSRPSIDVLFESAADVMGPRCAGILLSGANADGALGLRAIEEAGGSAMVQVPEEAEQRAMPDAALAVCSTARALSAQAIGRWLQQLSPAWAGSSAFEARPPVNARR
jgi:two-component system chemotaxis response regulator CheB